MTRDEFSFQGNLQLAMEPSQSLGIKHYLNTGKGLLPPTVLMCEGSASVPLRFNAER